MKLDLTDEECELVFQGIQDLPFKQAAPLVQKIQKQFEEAHKKEEPAEDVGLLKKAVKK